MTEARDILYVDQTAKMSGGELNLYDFLRNSPNRAKVLLFEDGPFRPLLESLQIPVLTFRLDDLLQIRKSAGVRTAFSFLPSIWKVRRQLRQLLAPARILYANSQKAFILSAICKPRKKPLVWHLHDMLVPEHFSAIIRKVAVTVGNRYATVIIANSQATADAFAKEGGDVAKIRVIHCGLDPEPFAAVTGAEIAALRATLCPPGEFLVGVFGRLSEWKGQHVLLEALTELPDVHAILVGDALFGESAYKQRLEDRVSQPDLAGRVHLLGFRSDIPALMRTVDAVIHTSVSPEPFGRVIVEGMLANKPVIATRGGATAEIIEDGASGLLVNPGQPSELASAIEGLQRNPAEAARLASSGYTRANSQFHLNTMVQRINDVLAAIPVGSNEY